ncbi:hypothetical protein D1BOALGB6SA_3234 [Olavius sp. associated proteobacterium Delta 1]|nr:hypothetical protein D1BOALGB6SA_3234 [Olavius sp. associated proteobacterium Delta 1]
MALNSSKLKGEGSKSNVYYRLYYKIPLRSFERLNEAHNH